MDGTGLFEFDLVILQAEGVLFLRKREKKTKMKMCTVFSIFTANILSYC